MIKLYWKIALIFIVVWCVFCSVVVGFNLFPSIYLMHMFKAIIIGSFVLLAVIGTYYMSKIVSTMAKPYDVKITGPTIINLKKIRALCLSIIATIFLFIIASMAASNLYRLFFK